MTPSKPELLTAEDLLRLHSQGVGGELIRGVLGGTVSTGQGHGKIAARLVAALVNFVDEARLGTVVTSQTGVVVDGRRDMVREPDIAFTTADRIRSDSEGEGYTEVVPDLVVEIAARGDTIAAVNDRSLMWLSHGARLVWAVHPDTRTVDVHRPDARVTVLGEEDALDGMDVLPGFSCPLSPVFGA